MSWLYVDDSQPVETPGSIRSKPRNSQQLVFLHTHFKQELLCNMQQQLLSSGKKAKRPYFSWYLSSMSSHCYFKNMTSTDKTVTPFGKSQFTVMCNKLIHNLFQRDLRFQTDLSFSGFSSNYFVPEICTLIHWLFSMTLRAKWTYFTSSVREVYERAILLFERFINENFKTNLSFSYSLRFH